MREERARGRLNKRAVAPGSARTGRLVTAAGLIMLAAFLGFVAGSLAAMQRFGFGLAAAVLIDITLVRAIRLPPTEPMKLVGRWS